MVYKFFIRMFHSDIINQVIDQVQTRDKYDEIYNFSKKKFQIQQYNIGKMYPKEAKRNHESLRRRYETNQIEVLPTYWNQGEKKLFLWFIICFLYIKKIKIEDISQHDLESLSTVFNGKANIFLDFQLRNLPTIPKFLRLWSEQQDELLKEIVQKLKIQQDDGKPFNNWNEVAKLVFFQRQRKFFKTAKSCRQRWFNHVDPSIKRNEFSVEEDLKIIEYIMSSGKSWSKIAKFFNHERTEHKIKNRYNTILKTYQGKFRIPSQFDEEQAEQFLLKKIKRQIEGLLMKDNTSGEQKSKSSSNLNVDQIRVQRSFSENMEPELKEHIYQEQNNKNQQALVKTQIIERVDISIVKNEAFEDQCANKTIENVYGEYKLSEKELLAEVNELEPERFIGGSKQSFKNPDWMWNYYPLANYHSFSSQPWNQPMNQQFINHFESFKCPQYFQSFKY